MDLTCLDKLDGVYYGFQSYMSSWEERKSLWEPKTECIVYTVTLCISRLQEIKIQWVLLIKARRVRSDCGYMLLDVHLHPTATVAMTAPLPVHIHAAYRAQMCYLYLKGRRHSFTQCRNTYAHANSDFHYFSWFKSASKNLDHSVFLVSTLMRDVWENLLGQIKSIFFLNSVFLCNFSGLSFFP